MIFELIATGVASYAAGVYTGYKKHDTIEGWVNSLTERLEKKTEALNKQAVAPEPEPEAVKVKGHHPCPCGSNKKYRHCCRKEAA